MLTTVKLAGPLGKKFGRKFDLDINTARESVNALASMVDGFEKYMTEAKDKGIAFAVFYGKRNLTLEETGELNVHCDEIRIVPVVIGSKNGGVFNLIIGAVLIAVAMFAPISSTLLAGAIMNAGVAMTIGGVMQLLAPMPKGTNAGDDATKLSSASFTGPTNRAAQGSCLPVLYGRQIIGSVRVAISITAQDAMIVPDTSKPVVGDGGTSRNTTSGWINDRINEAQEQQNA